MLSFDTLAAWSRRNTVLKLLALALALGTFLEVRRRTSWELRLDAPVEVRVDTGVAVLPPEPATVSVTLHGAREEIERLDREAVRVAVRPRAAGSDSGEAMVEIGRGAIEGAGRLRVSAVEPERVRVRFDREDRKVLRVAAPRTTGSPLRGRAEVEYEPKAVTVQGSQRGLARLEELDTEAVDVDGRVESFVKRVRVLPPSAREIWVSSIQPPEVTARVLITSRMAERTVTNVPVRALLRAGEAARVRFDPAAVDVTLEGRDEELAGIAEDAVQVFADCSGLMAPSTNTVTAVPHLPHGTEAKANVRPPALRATLSRD